MFLLPKIASGDLGVRLMWTSLGAKLVEAFTESFSVGLYQRNMHILTILLLICNASICVIV